MLWNVDMYANTYAQKNEKKKKKMCIPLNQTSKPTTI